jgi:hypothetical protein
MYSTKEELGNVRVGNEIWIVTKPSKSELGTFLDRGAKVIKVDDKTITVSVPYLVRNNEERKKEEIYRKSDGGILKKPCIYFLKVADDGERVLDRYSVFDDEDIANVRVGDEILRIVIDLSDGNVKDDYYTRYHKKVVKVIGVDDKTITVSVPDGESTFTATYNKIYDEGIIFTSGNIGFLKVTDKGKPRDKFPHNENEHIIATGTYTDNLGRKSVIAKAKRGGYEITVDGKTMPFDGFYPM